MEEYVVTWKRMIELKSGDTKVLSQKKKKNDTKVQNTRNKEKSLVVLIKKKIISSRNFNVTINWKIPQLKNNVL